MKFPRLLAAAIAALAIPVVTASAHAADFPQHEVRLVVPFPAGGPTDTIARIVAHGLNVKWGQPVVVENKPGAGTMIGTAQVAKAAPDGYTLGMAISAYTINPAIHSKMAYDTLKDLTGVTELARSNMVLVAQPGEPFNTLPELIKYARSHPGKLTYATPGLGTATHLAGEMFKKAAGVDIVHVPYNGSGPALTDLLGGRVDLMFDLVYSAHPYIESGKLKAIALTSAERDATLPSVPVMSDTLPGFKVYSVMGLVTTAGAPVPAVAKIQRDVAAVLAQPEVKKRFASLGVMPIGSSPADWNALIRSEIQRWTQVAHDSNIHLD
ncbi:tripartite tricarboxylate transporter substrate binding protein [Paralcaligenes sp. KSB-10]|uniref:tripartite tricarboxylate transporter substrate binding protein n=1 Tax=Paralcaligenes sp. KSB-10 TaxID=2901142 RepID=UPI001E626F91|nr:tripartite tricarboxylate transporter substrate binding protein [Paralcaligenes sp. KSB-10]UHL62733.1 tripartite tricarboxylate transporter substrate binding protein [Paralcaligenes sp. KSB-10]